jgi:hypothetical protein
VTIFFKNHCIISQNPDDKYIDGAGVAAVQCYCGGGAESTLTQILHRDPVGAATQTLPVYAGFKPLNFIQSA